MSETCFESPFGSFELQRLPRRQRELLRAWDAADEYLLQILAEDGGSIAHPLICNDAFGALAVALHEFHPVSWSDSWLAHQATRENLLFNGIDVETVECIGSTQAIDYSPTLVLIKLPKNFAFLEYQLIQLKPLLKANSRVIIAGMTKVMSTSVWEMCERILGPTVTSRAKKKARLIYVTLDKSLPSQSSSYPKQWLLEGTDLKILNHANVFSRDGLDIGTRFFINNLPQTSGPINIVDLGCGNGILGLSVARQNPQANLYMVDESYMAIASARHNLQQMEGVEAEFYLADGLQEFAQESMDLVLCNPPFHHHHAVGDLIALSMFKDSARVLKTAGELWVIGNRHLGYHHKLRRWFNQVELVASNNKFVIVKAQKD